APGHRPGDERHQGGARRRHRGDRGAGLGRGRTGAPAPQLGAAGRRRDLGERARGGGGLSRPDGAARGARRRPQHPARVRGAVG
ncbi:MAG: Glycerol kinase, partial [uncultured Solirubrobacteraceae bacterium]